MNTCGCHLCIWRAKRNALPRKARRLLRRHGGPPAVMDELDREARRQAQRPKLPGGTYITDNAGVQHGPYA